MTNPLHDLRELGQSVWYDNIRRALLTSGELARYRDEYAVSGVTSNPTIFERAISGSGDYDDALGEALERGVEDPEELFWELAVEDIRGAADVLRPGWERTGGADGYACLELPPRLSRDTEGSVALGRELFDRLDRPNVMIKVPGTPEGVPAIEELTAAGVNVNVTLLFSLSQWRAVVEAYLSGLERRREQGEDLDVASVASFFISRIDRKANERLPDDLRNRIGVASAELAYAAWQQLSSTQRWQSLAAVGARPQRLLWASTSTKDPALPETYYVEALAAPDTVNTMPERTLLAFAREGRVEEPLTEDASRAAEILHRAEAAGLDLTELGVELQDEGDDKFATSFDRLLECIGEKATALQQEPPEPRLGPLTGPADEVMGELTETGALQRMWDHDHTLWQRDPDEVADRLGWLESPEEMEEQVAGLAAFAKQAAADGLTDALLVGMGGSSLFPMVAARILAADGALTLHVLDSVHPDAIRRVERALPLESTLVVAASKSGTTVETRTLLEHLWERVGDPDRFAVVTDPGTPLAELARERGFRAVFEARPDLGGRYSALSHYGLVPAVLAGADVAELLHRAGRMAAACAACVPPDTAPGSRLAGALAAGVRVGRDKLTLVHGDRLAAFALWIEQLVAESTGKGSTGLVPVVGEPVGRPEVYGDDRLFVALEDGPEDGDRLEVLARAGHPVIDLAVDQAADLGAEVLRWEIATALAGAVLDVNPFDQPDVEAAKDAARAALEEGVPEVEPEPAEALLASLAPGDYLAIQAYVDPEAPVVADLQGARVALRDRHRVATTLGIGPRYLHSTGQLHKGGPDRGVFLQVVDESGEEVPIPGEDFGFGALARAQAAGDLRTLTDRGRRAARVEIDDLLEAGR